MARSLQELQNLLKALDGVTEAYTKAPTEGMKDDSILIERSAPDSVQHADNKVYHSRKGYTVIVMTRDEYSLIPDQVGNLPHSTFDRMYRLNGLFHFAYKIFF